MKRLDELQSWLSNRLWNTFRVPYPRFLEKCSFLSKLFKLREKISTVEEIESGLKVKKINSAGSFKISQLSAYIKFVLKTMFSNFKMRKEIVFLVKILERLSHLFSETIWKQLFVAKAVCIRVSPLRDGTGSSKRCNLFILLAEYLFSRLCIHNLLCVFIYE